jgi:hypothetical protein
MKMKFVTTDKLFEHVDELEKRQEEANSHRNQLMYDVASLKNSLLEYVHKKDFYAY